MSKSPKRIRQVGDVIRQQVAMLLKKEVSDPRLAQVSITSVHVSPDLSHARVMYTLPKTASIDDADKAFAKARGYMRSMLASSIDMRYVPKLSFVYDKTLERGGKITELLDDVLSEEDKQQRFKPSSDE